MTAITRRDALLGASAAAVVAGVPLAAIAASEPVMPMFAQMEKLYAESDACMEAYGAAKTRIPAHLIRALESYRAPLYMPAKLRAEYDQAYVAVGCERLSEESDEIMERYVDIEVELFQTPATTYQGLIAKTRAAYRISSNQVCSSGPLEPADAPGYPNVDGVGGLESPVMLWSIVQDLERLAGGAQS